MNVEKMRPLYDRLYVKRQQAEEKTAGGLYIPEGSKEKGQTGVVVSVGSGKFDDTGKQMPLQVKIGDTVFFGKYSGTDVDEQHVILKEEEVLGVLDK